MKLPDLVFSRNKILNRMKLDIDMYPNKSQLIRFCLATWSTYSATCVSQPKILFLVFFHSKYRLYQLFNLRFVVGNKTNSKKNENGHVLNVWTRKKN